MTWPLACSYMFGTTYGIFRSISCRLSQFSCELLCQFNFNPFLGWLKKHIPQHIQCELPLCTRSRRIRSPSTRPWNCSWPPGSPRSLPIRRRRVLRRRVTWWAANGAARPFKRAPFVAAVDAWIWPVGETLGWVILPYKKIIENCIFCVGTMISHDMWWVLLAYTQTKPFYWPQTWGDWGSIKLITWVHFVLLCFRESSGAGNCIIDVVIQLCISLSYVVLIVDVPVVALVMTQVWTPRLVHLDDTARLRFLDLLKLKQPFVTVLI